MWAAHPLPSQEASSPGGHPCPRSLGRHGKALLITAAVIPNRTRCPGALQMQTSLQGGNASAAAAILFLLLISSALSGVILRAGNDSQANGT